MQRYFSFLRGTLRFVICALNATGTNICFYYFVCSFIILLFVRYTDQLGQAVADIRATTKLVNDPTDAFLRISLLYYEMGDADESLKCVYYHYSIH